MPREVLVLGNIWIFCVPFITPGNKVSQYLVSHGCFSLCGAQRSQLKDSAESWDLLSRALGCSRTFKQGVRPDIVSPCIFQIRWKSRRARRTHGGLNSWVRSHGHVLSHCLAGIACPWCVKTTSNIHRSFSVCALQ